ncbi:MAG: hypothetical protein J6J36_09260 [Clostridia bacterium]|nr:hypothetical protein [Clostridia bacterium]
MLNTIWSFFIIISIAYGIFSGRVENINDAIFSTTENSVKIIVTLFCTMCLWSGIMNIASNISLMDKLCKVIEPIVNYLFPEYKKSKTIKKQISMNIIANLLGMGNAATPLGLEAIKNMQKESKDKSKLSTSMMLFILINTASIQLIPTTILAVRRSANSSSPSDIIIPVWISTICAVMCGIFCMKVLIKRGR